MCGNSVICDVTEAIQSEKSGKRKFPKAGLINSKENPTVPKNIPFLQCTTAPLLQTI